MRRVITVVLLATALAALASLTAIAGARTRTSPGCLTHACSRRVCTATACKSRIMARSRPTTPGVASVYGPGLYGNALGCGGTLTPGTVGVAHKTLPCHSRVKICVGDRCTITSVIDRGPYVGGRDFDMTTATAAQLGLGIAVYRVTYRPMS